MNLFSPGPKGTFGISTSTPYSTLQDTHLKWKRLPCFCFLRDKLFAPSGTPPRKSDRASMSLSWQSSLNIQSDSTPTGVLQGHHCSAPPSAREVEWRKRQCNGKASKHGQAGNSANYPFPPIPTLCPGWASAIGPLCSRCQHWRIELNLHPM